MKYPTSYRTIEIDGPSIFYQLTGPKDAHVLLLLYGLRFPSTSQDGARPSVAISAARESVRASMPWSKVRNECACGGGNARDASASASCSLSICSRKRDTSRPW